MSGRNRLIVSTFRAGGSKIDARHLATRIRGGTKLRLRNTWLGSTPELFGGSEMTRRRALRRLPAYRMATTRARSRQTATRNRAARSW